LAGAPEGEPFPLDLLPCTLTRFINEVAVAKNCPIDYVAVPLLALAGSAIGASRSLEIKSGWRERPCLYAAVIGSPGSAKTPALKAVAGPVYAEQSRRFANYRRQRIAWEEGPQETPLPKLQSLYVSDITTEKLATILQDNPRGVALIRDELTAWVGAMDAYRAKGKGADRQAYLSMWAGEAVRIDRKTEAEPIFVPHPFVGIVGGLTPSMLPTLRGDQHGDGFFDRVLLSYPVALPAKSEDWMAVDPATTELWASALAQLWELQPEETKEGELRPRFVRLTTDGRKAWEQFTTWLAAEQNREDIPDPLKGHLSKFKGYCARLALILHYLRLACLEMNEEDVDGVSVHQAGKLIRYFDSHARKVHAVLGSDAEVEDARRVLQWIEREKPKEFKRYDVFMDVRSQAQFPRIEDLDRPLDRLEKHRYIRREEVKAKGTGRPPAPVWRVNPATYESSRESRKP
jgi:hypothetical protein